MGGKRGRLITLEGGEGAGKSTQAARLADFLRGRGITTLTTREPGGAPTAEQIRGLLVEGGVDRWRPWSEALLHVAARIEHVETTVRPALEAGQWVVCDRFADSTLAYQGYGLGLEVAALEKLHALVLGDFLPDLTLVLDLSVAAGVARVAARDARRSRYERMDTAFHERLRSGYLDIARRAPQRCAVIDAGGDMATVAAAIMTVVTARLAIGGQSS